MNDLILELKKKPLSSHEILSMINGKANLLTYPDLAKFDNIDDALGPHKALILIYLTKNNFGHWTCLFKEDENTIEFFDSYGLLPDDEIKFIPEHFRMMSNQELPHLTALLYKSGCKIIYNEHHLQEEDPHVNTCGRYCALRLILRKMKLQEFVKLITCNKKCNPDNIVVKLTLFLMDNQK